MTRQSRILASARPQAANRWRKVHLDADLRRPFSIVAPAPEHPSPVVRKLPAGVRVLIIAALTIVAWGLILRALGVL